MKFFFVQPQIYTVLIFAFAAFTFIACEKEESQPPLKPTIVGTWDITSYKLSGDEYMGHLVDSAYLRFDAYQGAEGTFLEFVAYPDSDTVSLLGTYQVDDEQDEVSMVYDDETIVAKIKFDGNNKLEWNSEETSYPLVIKATRR